MTWDQSFCTRVCELEVGDECQPGIPIPGVNRCRDDLICTRTRSVHTCQSPVEYNYEDNYHDLICTTTGSAKTCQSPSESSYEDQYYDSIHYLLN